MVIFLKSFIVKRHPSKGVDYADVQSFLANVLTNPVTRAVIDVSATFQGVSNEAVAQELAGFYRKKTNHSIQHVLYFNEQQVLCALDIDKPSTPIVLKTSDEQEISRILGSTPDKRFTYYDQAHTVGTDIRQAKKVHAVVLADEKTSLQAFLQGSMRMRGLADAQTMAIVVLTQSSHLSREQLMQRFADNDSLALWKDNLTAAKLGMANVLRRQCLTLIQDLRDRHKISP
jgi:hypothetical protein